MIMGRHKSIISPSVRFDGAVRRAGWPLFALLLAGTASLPGCAKTEAKESKHAVVGVPVTIAKAVQKDMPVEIRAIARVEAQATVTIKPQVGGQIVKVHFQEGQDVGIGDPLFSIDARPFDAALRQAEATLAKDTAMAKDAEVEAAWQADLIKQGAGAQREHDRAQATADSLQATLRADAAAVDKARLDVEYCSIKCPIKGRTGTLLVDAGNVVKINDTALVTINRVAPIYVTFSVPERHLAKIMQYQAAGPLKVDAIIDQAAGLVDHGELTFIDNQVDRTTGTIQLKGTFENKERHLWPGQFVNVVLTLTTQPHVVVVPSPAVQTGQSGLFIFVVKGYWSAVSTGPFGYFLLVSNLTVDSRPVVTGLSLDGQTVIERGVSAGETVVTDGQLRLVSGAKIELKGTPTSPTNPTATQPASPTAAQAESKP
jgi:membrane fusion protein, multidrug efflux system